MNKKCQVFTPSDYVKELLDNVGYVENLYGKKIMENSCGDGNILAAVVQRYIDDCRNKGLSRTKIKNGLARDIYGVEIDPEQYKKCIERLNQILEINQIQRVHWNIVNKDYLKLKDNIKYRYVVGNPPYITYRDMNKPDQEFLKKRFVSCKKGKFDYCYAFIEKSIQSLDAYGKMAYLIPSSIFKTVFGLNLRDIMKQYIVKILDYTQETLFDGALVKSSIMILDANKQDDILHYTDVTLQKTLELPIQLMKKKWFFTENMVYGNRRFGDYFKVSNVVATLLNDAYVLKQDCYEELDNFYCCNNRYIEKSIVRDTAAPRTLRCGKKEKIIFPYYFEGGQLRRYEADEFEQRFPGAKEYLNDYRERLNKRKSDESSKWFEYGRSQAIAGLNTDKLLISTVITSEVAVYRLSSECIPYAGMYIVKKENNQEITLDEARRILSSRNFMQYVFDVGIHISGSSLRITSKDIEDYRF